MNTRDASAAIPRTYREVMDALANALRGWRYAGWGDDRSALAAYDALLAEGSASSEGAEAVAPFAYVYEWDNGRGIHRSLSAMPWYGRYPDRSIAVYTHPQPAQGEPAKDRDADRARFPNAEFNGWLDDGISDAGHTVYDTIGSVVDAWHGWQAREYYGPKSAQGEHEQRSCEGSAAWPRTKEVAEALAATGRAGDLTYSDIGDALAATSEGSERRPIADEVVSPHAETQRKVALGPQPDYYTAEQTEFLESALPRGLPAGSDAGANDNEVCEGCKPDCQYRCGACPVPSTASKTHAEQSSGGDARVTDAKVVPYGSASGEKDYAYGYEKGYADGWNAAIRAAKQRTIAAQQRQGGGA